MDTSPTIPVYTLYGETDHFPDVVHCESFSARAPLHDWSISAHRHSNMAQLFLFMDGQVTAKVDNDIHELGNKDYLYIPARCVHGFQFKPNMVGHVFSMPNSVANSIGPATEELQTALGTAFTGKIEAELKALTDALRSASRSLNAFRAQRSVGLAHSVLAFLAESRMMDTHSSQSLPQVRIRKLDALIAEQMGNGWTASEYAKSLAVTTGHLSRLCRNASGLGASAYIEHRVMEEASRLLAFTQMPVSEIGYRLGFSDPSYFSKRFQKVLKDTPTKYRSQFLN